MGSQIEHTKKKNVKKKKKKTTVKNELGLTKMWGKRGSPGVKNTWLLAQGHGSRAKQSVLQRNDAGH